MKYLKNKKTLLVTSILTAIIVAHSFAQNEHKEHEQMKPQNLKILPKDISVQELHKIMREYSMSLGVHCDFCHVKKEEMVNGHPKMDFAADDKPEKNTAREMMRMTAAINEKYIGKMTIDGHAMEQVTCVTCHHGQTTPIANVDSLMKK